FSAGVLIGELHGRVLVPSHQFFSAYGRLFKRQAHVDADTAKRYIAGLEIPASFEGSGFCSVIYRGAPLGGGKASGGIIKNHYPKGLRRALQ
ncbi:MAG: tRNA and rRNA cytosine-C5-methylase, partial [Clostridia bacterium]|nr:tRNA and rRNA cytosine-C5-methylase [Clostridia bacterium]